MPNMSPACDTWTPWGLDGARSQRAIMARDLGDLSRRFISAIYLGDHLAQGWLEKKGEKVAMGDGWKKRFFVLSSRQEQTGEDLDVQYYLHYFKSEDQVHSRHIFFRM